jgi:serine/threonine protein kinase
MSWLTAIGSFAVHSEASARGGSVFPSTHGFQSYSSNNSLQQKPTGAMIFTMDELSRGTGNFSPSNKIGQGGFGLVYRGKLRDGRIVAIKRGKKVHFFRINLVYVAPSSIAPM